MGAKTGIEWTDATWNPIRGCSRVSEGCRHCYAERQAAHPRLGGPGKPYEGLAVMQNGQPHWTGKIEFVEKHLLDPLHWKPIRLHEARCGKTVLGKQAACTCRNKFMTRPRRIFVNSMSDLFHESVTDEMRDRIYQVIEQSYWRGLGHQFQILTKRPAIALDYTLRRQAKKRAYAEKFALCPTEEMRNSPAAKDAWKMADPLPNLWLGVSVENQQAADERVRMLLKTPAAVRFISAEPLLGSVSLRWKDSTGFGNPHPKHKHPQPDDRGRVITDEYDGLRELDWVICGGESGPGARPMHPDWARGLRDQCAAAGVPFFFKQWGEYLPAMTDGGLDRSGAQVLNASDQPLRVGKHAAGALLDGVEWKQFPEVRV